MGRGRNAVIVWAMAAVCAATVVGLVAMGARGSGWHNVVWYVAAFMLAGAIGMALTHGMIKRASGAEGEALFMSLWIPFVSAVVPAIGLVMPWFGIYGLMRGEIGPVEVGDRRDNSFARGGTFGKRGRPAAAILLCCFLFQPAFLYAMLKARPSGVSKAATGQVQPDAGAPARMRPPAEDAAVARDGQAASRLRAWLDARRDVILGCTDGATAVVTVDGDSLRLQKALRGSPQEACVRNALKGYPRIGQRVIHAVARGR